MRVASTRGLFCVFSTLSFGLLVVEGDLANLGFRLSCEVHPDHSQVRAVRAAFCCAKFGTAERLDVSQGMRGFRQIRSVHWKIVSFGGDWEVRHMHMCRSGTR